MRRKREHRIPLERGQRWPGRLVTAVPAVLLHRVRLAASAAGRPLGEWTRGALWAAAWAELDRLGFRAVLRPASPVYRGGVEVLRSMGGERVLILAAPEDDRLPAAERDGERLSGRGYVVDVLPGEVGQGIPWCRSVTVHREDVVPVGPVRPAGPPDPSGFGVL